MRNRTGKEWAIEYLSDVFGQSGDDAQAILGLIDDILPGFPWDEPITDNLQILEVATDACALEYLLRQDSDPSRAEIHTQE